MFFDFTTIQQELENQYKQQYDWGWFGDETTAKNTLKGYVALGILSKEGYKRITGVEYREARNQSPVAQS
ncbi:XkdX family protein [Lactobacillus hominis]|uniref:XkdX family protein n=1 Tax=Lactobacillus hominis DSM 23910 = CRBIP 24.179 TaxID=1423758 RepID=I7JUV5_9LACO|nr:XkdX family protein [Lactobacillus hominis]KRM85733.1 hypothetical protein FC41_GL001048 [Lactobacillus hominis DSM 23910 = CRBIP 24.179]MCT3347220.1 XkdX family protein [Lactobacillus hominis]CCI81746.1 Putative uncharacterized protein orf57 [Lactobacillus hominis DSM 23910 = CRBIP 24.179]